MEEVLYKHQGRHAATCPKPKTNILLDEVQYCRRLTFLPFKSSPVSLLP